MTIIEANVTRTQTEDMHTTVDRIACDCAMSYRLFESRLPRAMGGTALMDMANNPVRPQDFRPVTFLGTNVQTQSCVGM